jgi:hypothetical protein
MTIQVLGVDNILLAVGNFTAARAFYDTRRCFTALSMTLQGPFLKLLNERPLLSNVANAEKGYNQREHGVR